MSRDPQLPRVLTEADYMHFLIEAGELLSSSLDYRSTLKNVCAAAVETVADICFLDVGSAVEVETVGAAARGGVLADGIECRLKRDEGRPAHPVAKVIDSGQTFFARVIDEEWIETHASNDAYASFMRRMHYRSMIIVPVRSQIWGVAGALTLIRTGDASPPYDEEAVAFAQDLGRRCGIAIGKARLHSQTVDIAERLQKAALPQSIPNIPGLVFDVLYEPADAALLVGGDWYDVFVLKDGKVGISIGDVSGHGIDSAAQMSSIRNAIRMGVVMESDLAKVLLDADYLFRNEVPEGTFCSALIAVVDPSSGTFSYVSAGHPGPVIWNRGASHKAPVDPLPPLAYAALAHEQPTITTLDLNPGCTVVLHTDGLLEAERRPLEAETTLLKALNDTEVRNAAHPALALRNACIRGAHADDLAVLVMRYEGQGG